VSVSRTKGRRAALLGCALAMACVGVEAAVTAAAAKRTDSLQLRKGVLEIRSPSGVGSGQLLSDDGAWPTAPMTVRLKGFREIEHFRATAGALTFLCEVERAGGVSTTRRCRLGDKPAGEVQLADNGFVVTIPAALFAEAGEGIVLEWVDYWR